MSDLVERLRRAAIENAEGSDYIPLSEIRTACSEAAAILSGDIDPLDVAARAIMDVDPAGAEKYGAMDMETARLFANAAIRAYEAIPDSAPPPRDPVDESFVDYTGLGELEFLDAVAADAMKWGEAFCQIAAKHGIIIDDVEWMAGFFANAIEAGAQRERSRQRIGGPSEDPAALRATIQAIRDAAGRDEPYGIRVITIQKLLQFDPIATV